jgi:hypothetical protein
VGAEFNWWLLIVGVVVGGALTWLVMADSNRREQDVDDRELPAEAAWIARYLQQPKLDAETAARVLHAHRTYLGFPPPDVLMSTEEVEALEPAPASQARPGTPTEDRVEG